MIASLRAVFFFIIIILWPHPMETGVVVVVVVFIPLSVWQYGWERKNLLTVMVNKY